MHRPKVTHTYQYSMSPSVSRSYRIDAKIEPRQNVKLHGNLGNEVLYCAVLWMARIQDSVGGVAFCG